MDHISPYLSHPLLYPLSTIRPHPPPTLSSYHTNTNPTKPPLVRLRRKVAEPLVGRDGRDAQAGIVKRILQRLRRVGVLHVGPRDIRVDERDDAPQRRRRRQRRVVADGRDRVDEGVGVLLGGDERRGARDDLRVVAEDGDDLVGQFELEPRVSFGWLGFGMGV